MSDQHEHWAYDEVRRFAAQLDDLEVRRQVELWGGEFVRTLLSEELESAYDALRKYGSHDANCYYQRGGDYCTCGLNAAQTARPVGDADSSNASAPVRQAIHLAPGEHFVCRECLDAGRIGG